MSKAANSTQFRKVNVDDFNEDNFQDEQLEETTSNAINEAEIQGLITSKKYTDALLIILKNPPVNTADKQQKDKAFTLFMRVIGMYRSSEVDEALKSLDSASLDVLMKYIYRGFAEPTDSVCPILLTFHDKVVAVAGLGCIVRVLTDRKKV